MTPAGRSSRADGGRQRWLILGLVITAVALIIDASVKSSDPTPGRQLAAQAWADRALALVDQSNVEGDDLTSFRRSPTTALNATEVTADLTTLSTGAAAVARQLASVRPPASLNVPAGLLQTCLAVRAQAAAAISGAVTDSLHAGSTAAADTAAKQWGVAAQQLQVADEAYRLFAADLPAAVGPAPASVWVSDAGLYSTTALEVWVRALNSRVSRAPVYRLEIVTVGTTPAAMGTTGAGPPVELLPPSSDLVVTAVVGNLGNRDEDGLTVTASISAATGSPSARRPLRLAAGAVAAVTLGPLAPRLGADETLTVSVQAPAGSSTPPVTTTMRFQMPAPTSTSTTSTTGPTTSTTSTTTTTGATPPSSG